MMILRKANERGHVTTDWLDSWHTFSFGHYYDPRHMGFRALRVINDDRVAPGKGFSKHPHNDMEIITYVLEGALKHEDSLGQSSTIKPGDVQRMSAGTGVIHSEWNASNKEPVHLLQIWILPEKNHLPPSYEQASFSNEKLTDRLCLVASRSAEAGAITLQQDASIFITKLTPGTEVQHAVPKTRHVWVHVAKGQVELNGTQLETGDGAGLSNEHTIRLKNVGKANAEVLLFELA
jgi:redox-sensitive bicupin YhaK (pirin superfamily)